MAKRTIKQKKVKIHSNKRRFARVVTMLLVSVVGIYLTAQAFMAEFDSTSVNVQNPTLTQTCGLDIALVLDTSRSICSAQFRQMKSALTSFTTTFGGGETQFSVTKFANSATVVQSFTNKTTAVNNAINAMNQANGTNWEDALNKAKGTFDPRPNKQNLLIIATDGEPATATGRPVPVDSARQVANNVKSSGTRILVMGIIDNAGSPSVENMKQISGSNVNTGSVLTSDVITTSFGSLASNLATFANQTCGKNKGSFQGQNKGKSIGKKGGSGGGGSTAQRQADKPNPLPKTSSQGASKKQPEPEPSPFYDGKQYDAGSDVDNFVSSAVSSTSKVFTNGWPLALGVLALAGAGGYVYWRKYRK